MAASPGPAERYLSGLMEAHLLVEKEKTTRKELLRSLESTIYTSKSEPLKLPRRAAGTAKKASTGPRLSRLSQKQLMCTRRHVNSILANYECPCESKTDAAGQKMSGCAQKICLGMGTAEATEFVLEMRNERFEHSAHEDAPFYFQRLLSMRDVDPDTKKITVRFNVGGVACCAATHFVAYGYSEKNRKRQELVARVRRGEMVYRHIKAGGRRGKITSRGDICRAWIHKIIGRHGEFVPAPRSSNGYGHVALEARSLTGWHRDYLDEVAKGEDNPYARCVKIWQFRKIWKSSTLTWTAPSEQVERLGGMLWEVHTRSERTRGIRICDECAKWNRMRKHAKTRDLKDAAIGGKNGHFDNVKATRNQYATNQLEAFLSPFVASGATDATDQVKTRWPLCEFNAKVVEKLSQVKFKVTGFVDHILGYFMFITMPWIMHGANLSCTIMMLMFAYGAYDGKKKIFLQWDGATDNVNMTMIYYLCWILLAAQESGGPLVHIQISRLIVHHTHFDPDQYFSVMCRYMFGCTRYGLRRLNIFTLSQFEAMCRRAHVDLRDYKVLHACYDFVKLFENTRCAAIDKGIRESYVIELTTDMTPGKQGRIFYRQKKMMGKEWDNNVCAAFCQLLSTCMSKYFDLL